MNKTKMDHRRVPDASHSGKGKDSVSCLRAEGTHAATFCYGSLSRQTCVWVCSAVQVGLLLEIGNMPCSALS